MPILRDLTVSAYPQHEYKRDFNLQTNCVCALYLRALGKYKTDFTGKVIVQACQEDKVVYEKLIDVYRVSLQFDFEEFWSSVGRERKVLLLAFLHKGLMAIGRKLQWDVSLFEEAYDSFKDTELQAVFDWGKTISSPNRKKKAQIRYYYTLDDVQIYARVWLKGSDDLAKEYLFVTTEPHELRYVPYLGKLSWIDSDTIVLKPRSKKLNPIELTLC